MSRSQRPPGAALRTSVVVPAAVVAGVITLAAPSTFGIRVTFGVPSPENTQRSPTHHLLWRSAAGRQSLLSAPRATGILKALGGGKA